MADGRLWEEREARALNSDKLLCISQVTVGRVSIHHERSLYRPLGSLAQHGAAEFLGHARHGAWEHRDARARFPMFNASIPDGERLPGSQWLCCSLFAPSAHSWPENLLALRLLYHIPHVLLHGGFADADAQLKEFATDPFSSQHADCEPPFPSSNPRLLPGSLVC